MSIVLVLSQFSEESHSPMTLLMSTLQLTSQNTKVTVRQSELADFLAQNPEFASKPNYN
jgi:hypothetical protein